MAVKRPRVPPLGDELKGLFEEFDDQNKGRKKPTERDILAEIQTYRLEKQAEKDA